MAKSTPTRETWSARAVAALASDMTPRAFDGKDIRGLARGDSGPSVLPRFAEANADGTNRSHQYTQAEVTLLLEAVASRFAKRTGTTVRVPAPFAAKARKPRAPRKARPKRAPTAPTTDAAATVSSDAPSS